MPPCRNYKNYRVKKNIPPEFFDSPWPRLHTAQQKYTHIENLKLPRRSYRNYRVKRNAYIEILNCLVSLPAETTETTGWKRAYPKKLFDSPSLKLHTYIENLKAPWWNYRNYWVKWNACIENLNCRESLPLETTETTGYKWTYPPEFSDFHWLRLHTT